MSLEKFNMNSDLPIEGDTVEVDTKGKGWEEKSREIDAIKDGLGRGIDAPIKQAIIAFSLNGFPTCQSCGGHTLDDGEDGGAWFPWVQVQSPEPDNWKSDEAQKELWIETNEALGSNLQKLLDAFYEGRECLEGMRLTLHPHGSMGSFKVHCESGSYENMEDRDSDKTDIARREVDDFVEFLRGKFYES
jgi:hypothetical protein